jgi:hypothetical protein
MVLTLLAVITFDHPATESYCHSSSNTIVRSAVRYSSVVKYVQHPVLGCYHLPFVS